MWPDSDSRGIGDAIAADCDWEVDYWDSWQFRFPIHCYHIDLSVFHKEKNLMAKWHFDGTHMHMKHAIKTLAPFASSEHNIEYISGVFANVGLKCVTWNAFADWWYKAGEDYEPR